MKATYRKILVLNSFNDAILKLKLSSEDYAVISKLAKVVKKLQFRVEEFQEAVEDLRLDHCMKDGLRIIRENGQLQWTAEGEKNFRKAYKELLETEVEIDDITPMNYSEIQELIPNGGAGDWEDVKDSLSGFFEYHS